MTTNNLDDIIQWKQDLENEAMLDYLEATELANQEGDTLTMEFFKELAKDEKRHITDLLDYTDIGEEYVRF
jgi:bacterioferritin (cytochrome b1)